MFMFMEKSTTDNYTYLQTLSLHDAISIYRPFKMDKKIFISCLVLLLFLDKTHPAFATEGFFEKKAEGWHWYEDKPALQEPALEILEHSKAVIHKPVISRSEEHTSELHPLMRIPYAVSCLKKKKHKT